METEIWKDINWYEWIYQVSNLWNIKVLEKYRKNWKEIWYIQKQKIMKYSINLSWYCKLPLTKNFNKKTFYIHRLVALHFIENIKNKTDINHINWIKTDNRVENLEWVTKSENQIHRFDKLNKRNCNNKKISQFDINWNFIYTYHSLAEVDRLLWITRYEIYKFLKWKIKTAWGFKWSYLE